MLTIIKLSWISLLLAISSAAFAGPNGDAGTIIGGVAGGILGHQIGHGSGRTAATIGGAVLGSVVGHQMGQSADRPHVYVAGPAPSYQYSSWRCEHAPCSYPPRYRHTFIGPDGRLCRRAILTDDEGDQVYATFCCFRMSSDGYCRRWVRVNS
jgi:hypothetical protein